MNNIYEHMVNEITETADYVRATIDSSDAVKTPAQKSIHAFKACCKTIEGLACDLDNEAEAKALSVYAATLRREVTTYGYSEGPKPDTNTVRDNILYRCDLLGAYICDSYYRTNEDEDDGPEYDEPDEVTPVTNPELYIDPEANYKEAEPNPWSANTKEPTFFDMYK